jgi:DNA-binding NtrC family response regulator
VISATNVNLYDLVKARLFRDDLLYRLNSVEIFIPPLRERIGDTELLIKYFVGNFAKSQKRKVNISAGWMDAMLQHHWRGNVRELEHACEAALILCDENVLAKRHLPPSVGDGGEKTPRGLAEETCESLQENFQRWLLRAIETCDGNLVSVAKKYGISRTKLYSKIKEYDIDMKSFRLKRQGIDF